MVAGISTGVARRNAGLVLLVSHQNLLFNESVRTSGGRALQGLPSGSRLYAEEIQALGRCSGGGQVHDAGASTCTAPQASGNPMAVSTVAAEGSAGSAPRWQGPACIRCEPP